MVEDTKKLFWNEQINAVQTSPSEPLIVRDIGKGMVLDGTLIRLRDIGGTSQVGIVRCMQEKDRFWLEELSSCQTLEALSPLLELGSWWILCYRPGPAGHKWPTLVSFLHSVSRRLELLDAEWNAINVLLNKVPLPLNTILHVESPVHMFVCTATRWEELNRLQTDVSADYSLYPRDFSIVTRQWDCFLNYTTP